MVSVTKVRHLQVSRSTTSRNLIRVQLGLNFNSSIVGLRLMHQTEQVRGRSRDRPIDDPAVKSRCCEEKTERMPSIFLLPRHALSTRFSRLFGASTGLLMASK